MTAHATGISVTRPVGQAIDRVILFLFRPFDFGRWLNIGFCAWLATLGEPGYGLRFNYNASNRRPSAGGGQANFHDQFEHARTYVLNNLRWIIPLSIVLVVIGLVLGVVMMWLNSRGKFMFLHCVALEKDEVVVPWHKYAREGHSLFVFRFVLWLIGMVPMLPMLGVIAVMGVRMIHSGAPEMRDILVLVGVVMVLMLVGTVFLVINKLTTDFVVPIMFLRAKACLEGWSELLGLISANISHFVVYLLFQIVLALACLALLLAVILVTCCIAGCVLMIPYLGTVLILPVLAFKRSYSLSYLAQYGREYDVFPPASMPPPPQTPPSPMTPPPLTQQW